MVQLESTESRRLNVGPGAAGSRQLRFKMGANWFVASFIALWLCGWVFGEVAAIGNLLGAENGFSEGPTFTLIWLAGWTLGGLAAGAFLIWILFGDEIVESNRISLTHAFRVFGIPHLRAYQASQIANLRFVERTSSRSTRTFVAFDYGTRTIRIFFGIESAEASRVIAVLQDALGIRREG